MEPHGQQPAKVPLASIFKPLLIPQTLPFIISGSSSGDTSAAYSLTSATLPSEDEMLAYIRAPPHPIDPSTHLVHSLALVEDTDRRRRLMTSEAHLKARYLSWVLDPVGDCAFQEQGRDYAYELETVSVPGASSAWKPDFSLSGMKQPYGLNPTAVPMIGEAKAILALSSVNNDIVEAYQDGNDAARTAVNQMLGFIENKKGCNSGFLTSFHRTWFMRKGPGGKRSYQVYPVLKSSSCQPSLILAHIYFAKRAIFDPPPQPPPPATLEHTPKVSARGDDQPRMLGSSGPSGGRRSLHQQGFEQQHKKQCQQQHHQHQHQQQQPQAAPATSSSDASPACVLQSPLSKQAAPSSHDSPMAEAQAKSRVVPSSCLELMDDFLSVADNSSVAEGRLMGHGVLVKCGARRQGVNTDLADDQFSLVQREASIYDTLAPIQGVYIPRMLAHGTNEKDPNEYLLVLERLPGQHPSQDRPELRSPAMLEKAKEALQAIHELGIQHGDIRRTNILLGEQQQRVYLIDFGFSLRSTDLGMDEWERAQGRELKALCKVFDPPIIK